MARNSNFAIAALIASGLGAVLLLSVVAGVWNYSVAGNWFLASGILGVFGTLGGWLDRRQGVDRFNTLAMWLGAAVVMAFGALSLWLS